MSNNNNRNTLTAILILLILLLGAGMGYFIFQNNQLKQQLSETVQKKKTIEVLNAELQQEYDRSLNQLEDLEGENMSLDSLLTSKKEELRKNKAYIASILSKNNASEKELSDARNLISQLTNQRISLQSAVDSLKKANIALEQDNIALLQEKEIIKTTLDQVSIEASELEIENKDLKDERELASILSAKNITASGIRIKNGNKEVTVKKAGNARKLKICFELLENKIADEGPTPIQIRIIGPDGSTLKLEAMGSGTFINQETNEETQYTYEIAPNFENDGKSVCSYWDQNIGYRAGKYNVELFQKGFPIGSTSFQLN